MMNVVNSGGRFQIYGEGVKTYNKLPVASYDVNFHQMTGFFLTSRNDLIVNEDKIYGNCACKVNKVIKSYKSTNRNFGVLLSGQKGIGKSLFVRLIAEKGIKENYPVIVVSVAIPGIANFLSSIEQDCIIIFDEFEKTFSKQEDWEPQDDMLTLFDGVDGGHKLFIVTCNKLEKLSPYMLNRPGRFHYHFSLTAPTPDEVREYMQDKVSSQYSSAIEDIVNLAGVIDMPYDYLRAIAFELNQGYSIKETMNDLNITRVNSMRFDVKVFLSNGLIYESFSNKINLGERTEEWITIRRFGEKTEKYPPQFNISFIPAFAHMVGGEYIITESIHYPQWDADDFYNLSEEESKKMAEEMNKLTVDRIVLTKIPDMGPTRFLV